MAPLISVVISAYRNPHYLNQAVQSVLDQDFTDYELIVVDDASGEETVRDYALPSNARLIELKDRSRTAASRNAGIRAATGKYVALLDQDDLWLPQKLTRQVEFLEAHPEYALVFCHYSPVDNSLTPLPAERKARRRVPNALRMLIRGCFIRTPSTTLFRREAAIGVGLFDEAIIGASDWDFYLRLARDHGFGAIPETLVLYRMHAGQLHRNDDLMQTAKFSVYEKTLQWVSSERPGLRSLVRKYYCRTLRQASKFRIHGGNPKDAKGLILRAIRIWPWNVRSYGLLMKIGMQPRKRDQRREDISGNPVI